MPAPKAELFLLPNVLAPETANGVLPQGVISLVKNLKLYFCEDFRTTRRFISSLKQGVEIDTLELQLLNKDSKPADIEKMGKRLLAVGKGAIVSEAGCPAIADPGSELVAWAQKKGCKITPLVGPNSILLALMGSGFNGQSFTFHGYLPIDGDDRTLRIKQLENESQKYNRTQLFMETPFRNNPLLADLLKTLLPETQLCIAANITAPEESIVTKTVASWRKATPDLHKQPVMFVLHSVAPFNPYAKKNQKKN